MSWLTALWRRLVPPPRVPVYTCTSRGCEAPSVPQDGPFCPDHNWENCQ